MADVFCVGFWVWVLFETFPDPTLYATARVESRRPWPTHEMDGMPSVRTYIWYTCTRAAIVYWYWIVYGPHAYYSKKNVCIRSYGCGWMGRLVAVFVRGPRCIYTESKLTSSGIASTQQRGPSSLSPPLSCVTVPNIRKQQNEGTGTKRDPLWGRIGTCAPCVRVALVVSTILLTHNNQLTVCLKRLRTGAHRAVRTLLHIHGNQSKISSIYVYVY